MTDRDRSRPDRHDAEFALSPRGAVRRAFDSDDAGAAADDAWFRKLGIGARRCDLGDQGLYLAEELVRWSTWRTEEEQTRFGVFALALLLAVRQGSTRLSLEPRGPGAALAAKDFAEDRR